MIRILGAWLLLGLLLGLLLPGAASARPRRLMQVNFSTVKLSYDWSLSHAHEIGCCSNWIFHLHSWSADSQKIIGFSHYPGGSPLDTFQSLYAINLPARAVYRLFNTEREGANDPGLVWSWNSARDKIACQVRDRDLGYYVWNLDSLRYKYLPGPANPQNRLVLENLDAERNQRYAFEPVGDYPRYRQPLHAPAAPWQAFEMKADYGPNLASERQQQAYATPGRQAGYDKTVKLCAPGGAPCWEQHFAESYAVVRSPTPPYRVFAAWNQGRVLHLSLTPLGQTQPLRQRHLLLPATEPMERYELFALWHGDQGHGDQVAVLADWLYGIKADTLEVVPLANLAHHRGLQLLASPDDKAFAFSSFGHGVPGDRLEVWGWD